MRLIVIMNVRISAGADPGKLFLIKTMTSAPEFTARSAPDCCCQAAILRFARPRQTGVSLSIQQPGIDGALAGLDGFGSTVPELHAILCGLYNMDLAQA